MKLKVQYWSFYGENPGFYVWYKDWLWGWGRYDDIAFPTYAEAMNHAAKVKALNN